MLYGELADFTGDLSTSAALREAVVFLLEKAPLGSDGRHDLSGGAYADVKHYAPAPADQRPYESHVKYVDVQCVLDGEETIYVRPLDGMEPKEEYPDRDLTFFHEPAKGPEIAVTMRPGMFLVLFPKDCHKTECLSGPTDCRKVIVKVPVELLQWR